MEWLEDFLLHPGTLESAKLVLCASFPLLLGCAQHAEPALRLRVGACVKRILHASVDLGTARLCRFAHVAIGASLSSPQPPSCGLILSHPPCNRRAITINLKFTGLTQNLVQLEGSYRDFPFKLLGQLANFGSTL